VRRIEGESGEQYYSVQYPNKQDGKIVDKLIGDNSYWEFINHAQREVVSRLGDESFPWFIRTLEWERKGFITRETVLSLIEQIVTKPR